MRRKAKEGLLFDRGYVASPLCRPSLATLATGKFPTVHGVTGNDVKDPNEQDEVSAEHPEIVDELKKQILQWHADKMRPQLATAG